MPLRVKCRCGQELVVRYSEWVYVFLGIALLSLILNSVVLVLLYLRLESVSVANGRGSPAARPSSSAPPTAGNAPAAKAPGAAQSALPASSGAALQPSPAPLPAESAAPKDPADSLHAGRASDFPEPLSKILFPPRPPWEVALRSIVSDREKADGSGSSDATFADARGDSPAAPLYAEPLAEGGVLLRLLLLERDRGDSLLPFALLLDPDPIVRRRAMTRLLSNRAATANVATSSGDARALVAAAAPVIGACAQGKDLLQSLGMVRVEHGREDASSTATLEKPSSSTINGILDALREKTARELVDAPALALRRQLDAAAASGVDVVLAIDVSQSMEGALEAIQREAVWLLPALTWALPGLRVGLVLYRDEVEAEVDFTLVPAGDVLRVLRESHADGGGDVPEGVHEALKAALSLGRLRWRESADKHIVLVGDAPPPYDQTAGLLSVVRQAFRQGGYRVHALGVRPEEGRASVPFFPEIAKAGGGRAATVLEPSRCGSEVFQCLFLDESRPALDLLLPAVKALFSEEG